MPHPGRAEEVMSMPERSEAVATAKVLIADDNRDTREMHALYLSMLGYSVAVAADGREAVQSARSHRPDLIVMDLDMPEVDGWTAIRELKSDALTAAIPVIVLTGDEFETELKEMATGDRAVAEPQKPRWSAT